MCGITSITLKEYFNRYRSARATITLSVDAAVAEEANRRFVDWRFRQPGGSGLGILRTPEERLAHGPDIPQDFYLQYEDIEQKVHLWHEPPDRWREEIWDAEGSLIRCVVADGTRGPRWVYDPPNTALHDPTGAEGWPAEDPHTNLSFMLDPSEELFHYALVDDTTAHETSRVVTVAGRKAVEVLVNTVSWGYPPQIFHGFYAPQGTTDHVLLVDAEVGTILRVAARLEGREFYTAEVTLYSLRRAI